ncbi:MAG: hypothetical protein M1454_01875 [Candidatus Thermoplasmatota archaeon]|nr:hypothetical protein [Candidatus Thermoplasmatota archaeon]MCL5731546.1 hypothetical protein [Candidatus Thermoplasmatota archaeon]
MRSYLIRIGYHGYMFTGFQKGNGDRSIEDEIIRTLGNEAVFIRSASRTDRDVSAVANVVQIETEKPPRMIIHRMNSIHGLFAWGFASVDKKFNARHAKQRRYLYILDAQRIDAGLLEKRLRKFEGTHDFSSFCRKDHRNTVRTIDGISLMKSGTLISVEFVGKSFLWNQIRGIMAFSIKEDSDPFSLKGRYPYLADPSGLILLSVEYEDINFTDVLEKPIVRNIFRERNRAASDYTLFSILQRYVSQNTNNRFTGEKAEMEK